MRPPSGWRWRAAIVAALSALRSPPAASTTASATSRSRRCRAPLATPLYLDSAKLEPFRNGTAVLRQKVGTAKLQIDSDGGQLALLCNVVVQKNRITSVTISVANRQLRCQCGRPSVGNARTCIA